MSYVHAMGGVPRVLRFDGKKWPLGRYLVSRVEEQVLGGAKRSGYSSGYVLKLQDLQVELETISAREAREVRRQNHASSAVARVKINQSKKGIL